MNYLQKKKLAFMSIVNQVKGFVRSVSGRLPLTLEGCVNRESITNYKIYGQSIQDGEPTPDNPIEVESVGEYNESIGKYEISITVSGNGKPITTIIYLDEPLRKVGDYADYIDFENGKVVRRIGIGDLSAVPAVWIGLNNTPNKNGYYAHYVFTDGLANGEMLKGTNLRGYSNFLPCNSSTTAWNAWNSEQVRFGQNSPAIYIITANQMATKDDLRKYISNNGAFTPYVYYILETPIEKEIDLPTIPTHKGTSIITVGTTIQPSQAEIEYYSNVKE